LIGSGQWAVPKLGTLGAMQEVQASLRIRATAAQLFAVCADVPRWSRWGPDTRDASLDGPFALGSSGRLTPRIGRAVPMRISALTPERSFCVSCEVTGLRMQFDHRLEPLADGWTLVTHHALFTGPWPWMLGRLLVLQLRRGLPRTLASLRDHVESGAG
jgi:hypothetical protein